MQTSIVLLRDARSAFRQLGLKKTMALILLLTNLVVGPLLFPLLSSYVVYRFCRYGIASPSGIIEIFEATLEVIVVVFGTVFTLGGGYIGMRARGLTAFLTSLPLLLPYQLMISAAAWLGLMDLMINPYHWHKTVHAARPRSKSDDRSPDPAASS